jgi:acyl carrier protein
MVFSSLGVTQPTSVQQGSAAGEIRALVARHLHVDVGRVTDEAHLRHDLGADWLDRLELLLLIEDQFADVEITADDAHEIEVVGDLMRYVEGVRSRRGSLTAMSF